MFRDSKAWKERRKQGLHGVVTFDVYCDFCGADMHVDQKDYTGNAGRFDRCSGKRLQDECMSCLMKRLPIWNYEI